MNRTEFVIATAVILLLAFAMGWFAHWVLHRFSRNAANDLSEMDRLAQALHEAEELRDEAVIYLETREAELAGRITGLEGELRATMEGLREARHANEEMRSYIEKMHANS